MKAAIFLVAAIVGTTCSACLAADLNTNRDATNSSQSDNFYVAGNLGGSDYHRSISGAGISTSLPHNNSVFQNIRFGWRWDDMVGPEIGYAYFGEGKRNYPRIHAVYSAETRALTVGLNGKYEFYRDWFVTGHAGLLRSQTNISFSNPAVSCFEGASLQFVECVQNISTSNKSYNDSLYEGLGIGYQLTSKFSIGINYDSYRVRYNAASVPIAVAVNTKRDIGAISASLEYRF
jgi:OOP family OmpA-OmpF porin